MVESTTFEIKVGYKDGNYTTTVLNTPRNVTLL